MNRSSDAEAGGDRPVVVFDGGCGMCRRQMRRVQQLDWLGRLDRLEYDDAVQRWPEVARGTLGDGLRVRFPDGSVTVGIDAVRSIGMRMPPSALLAWGLYLPGVHAIAKRVYDSIAARRRRDEVCELPSSRG